MANIVDKLNPLTSTAKREPKFQVYQNKSNEYWHWRLVAANGEELAWSEAYKTKDGATKGVDALKRAAKDAEIVELDTPPTREARSK